MGAFAFGVAASFVASVLFAVGQALWAQIREPMIVFFLAFVACMTVYTSWEIVRFLQRRERGFQAERRALAADRERDRRWKLALAEWMKESHRRDLTLEQQDNMLRDYLARVERETPPPAVGGDPVG